MNVSRHRSIMFAAWRLLSLGVIFALVGCSVGSMAAAPVRAAGGLQGGTPMPTFILSGPDSTATPTPFQPLPPTALPGQPGAPAVVVTPSPTPTPQFTLPVNGLPQVTEVVKLPSQVNILLLGADRRPWDRQFRTDTIMLVTINNDLGRVNVTSFPRDLWLTLPGYGMGRINTAWTYGGYPLLRDTFKHNFGVVIDYYVLIEFSSFKKIVDDLGGLNVQVAEEVSDYRAGYWITIPAGEVHMDADTVLWYVRTRKTTSDIARNRRQQEVLYGIFERLLSLDVLRRAPEFYNLYKDSVQTNLGLVDTLKWLPFATQISQSRNIKTYGLTYNHVYDWITPEGAMVLVPQQEPMMQVIRKSQNLP